MLKRLTIRGFKSIRTLEDFELRDLNVLIGANGAGKSNFIALFQMLARLMNRSLRLFVREQDGPNALLFGGRKRTKTMKAQFVFDRNGYEFSLAPAGDGLVFADEATLFFGDRKDLRRSLGSNGQEEASLPDADDSFATYVRPAVAGWRVYHFHDTSPSAAVRHGQAVRDNARLKPDASNLAPFLRRLRERHSAAYRRIVDTIRLAAPFFGDFVYRQSPEEAIDLEWSESGDPDTVLGPRQLSDGTLRFICLATLLLQPSQLRPKTLELKRASATYAESGGAGATVLEQSEAAAVLLEKYDVCLGLFQGFDRSAWATGTATGRLGLLPDAQEHILAQGTDSNDSGNGHGLDRPSGRERFLRAAHEMSRAYALSVPHEQALRIRDDVGFFQAVAAALRKRAPGDAQPAEDMDPAVRPIISRAATTEGMADLFVTAGLGKPDASILADDFLTRVRGMRQHNLAVDLLGKLLRGELVTRRRRNIVQSRFFAEKLESSIRDYRSRATTAAQVIEELIQLARQMRQAQNRGDKLGLSDDELAFYDALDADDSAVRVLGNETLRTMVGELVETVHGNVKNDWMLRERVRVHLQTLVKRILRRHSYPTERQERAARTVLEQAENLYGG